jgi:phosphatidylglycerol:prolipoprotein diacylglycerol transferase
VPIGAFGFPISPLPSFIPQTEAVPAMSGRTIFQKSARSGKPRQVRVSLPKSAARSFLHDCLLVIIPSFIAVSILFNQPMNLAFAFIGTLRPLCGCFARLGCFLGGCCYGKPSSRGVLYPAAIFEASDCGCRRYSPSPNPGLRVFPIQLVEAGMLATLFAALAIFVWQVQGMAWSVFWLYLSLYAIVRFVLDFCRTTSGRPRCWRLSEAQVVCIAVQVVSLSVLVCR